MARPQGTERRAARLRGSGELTLPRIGWRRTAADLQRHAEASAYCTEAISFAPCAHWLHFERVDAGATPGRYKERPPTAAARFAFAPTTPRPASAAVTRTPRPSATKRRSRTRAAPSASTGTRQRPDGAGPASEPFRRSDHDGRESAIERPLVPKRIPPRTRPAAERHRHRHRIHRPDPKRDVGYFATPDPELKAGFRALTQGESEENYVAKGPDGGGPEGSAHVGDVGTDGNRLEERIITGPGPAYDTRSAVGTERQP